MLKLFVLQLLCLCTTIILGQRAWQPDITRVLGDHVSSYYPPHTPSSHTPTAPLPEDLVWEYVIQLVSALRLVHSANLALRCIHPTKLLLTSPHRLRISCAGIMDIVSTTANTLPTPIQQVSTSFHSVYILPLSKETWLLRVKPCCVWPCSQPRQPSKSSSQHPWRYWPPPTLRTSNTSFSELLSQSSSG